MVGKPVVGDASGAAVSVPVQPSPFIALMHRVFRLLLAGRTAAPGVLFAAPAVGSVVGATAMTARPNRVRKPGYPLLRTLVVYGVVTIGVGLSRIVPLTLALLMGAGAAITIHMTFRHQVMQLLAPNVLRGRVTATHQVFVRSGLQQGQGEAGVATNGFGAPFSIASDSGVCAPNVILIALLVPAGRRYRNAR